MRASPLEERHDLSDIETGQVQARNLRYLVEMGQLMLTNSRVRLKWLAPDRKLRFALCGVLHFSPYPEMV